MQRRGSPKRAQSRVRMHNADWTEALARGAEEAIGHRFSDRALLKTCFTHASLTNETGEPSNERLEFLGDAVLELCVTEQLYCSSAEDEGALTERRQRLVSQTALELAESRLGLVRYLRYTGGDDALRGKTRSNLFEAIVGALYLDGGMRAAKEFLARTLTETQPQNYKSLLQEYVQALARTRPVYSTEQSSEGYRCSVSALGESAFGSGKNKKAAETQAAESLYRILTERGRH